MGFFDYGSFQDQNDQFNDTHQPNVTHELLGGAVAYEAAKAYNDHCAANGQPVDHSTAKELMAGFAGAAVDRLVETKGLDHLDEYQRNRARQQAQGQLNDRLCDQYGSNNDCGNNDYGSGGRGNDDYGSGNRGNDDYGSGNRGNDDYGSGNRGNNDDY